MRTLFGQRLAQHALNPHAQPAMAMPGREIGYPELSRAVEACAAWLSRSGCAASEVVGITVADDYLHTVASLALLALGVPQVCLPTHDPASMRLHVAQRIGVSRAIVTNPTHALDGSETLLLTRNVLDAPARGRPCAAVDADPDAPAIYFASSGTTGDSKIFALSQRATAWRAERIAESELIAPGYRALTLVSVEETPGKTKRLHTLYLGMTAILPGDSQSATTSPQQLCARLGVTCLELGVLALSSIVLDRSHDNRFPNCTTVYASGSRVPLSLRQSFRSRFAAPLHVHYGAREFGRISSTYPDGDSESVESVGMPVPWIELEIVDGDGVAVPSGEVGELKVRSECMTQEYHRDPVATARHFKQGWFYPGDLASLTRAGALCLHGRSDDMMNLNSIKIFPAEIERVLEEHPGVKAAAVFAKSSAAHGDIPLAAVELHESAAVSVDELMARARERLGVRAPRRIFVVEALPRSAAGKILKRELVGLLAPGR
jgi:long-chain acyl-CoA synthetase